MTWTEKIQKHILNIEHRHVLFTIPQECRKFFFYDRSLLSKLSAAVNQVFLSVLKTKGLIIQDILGCWRKN